MSELENPFANKQIISLTELENSGYKIARLENNRTINDANVKAKTRSINEVGGTVSPITVVTATMAIKEGLKIEDFKSGDPVSNPENYFVIIDGQHRLQAILNLKSKGITKDCYFMLPLVDQIGITKLLSTMNQEVKKWNGKDFVSFVVMTLGDTAPELLKEMAVYTKNEFEVKTVYQYLTFEPNTLSNAELEKIANKETLKTELENKISKTSAIEYGKRIVKVLRSKFGDDKIIKSRSLSGWMINKLDPDYNGNKENLANDMVSFFGGLTSDQVKEIKTVKKDDEGNDKEQVLKNILNDLYSSFKEKQKLKQTA
ncbi:hypothetical protein SAMN05216357_13512 [Porphyromonadaceae bacterium KH3CP3RA]|nr:hypothetical protein SAMN05216357_13512 [Porphyromonadaceae bacterium KH3CP3RA]